MDFEGVMLNEVSNTEKDKSIWSHLYVEFGTKQNTHTHTHTHTHTQEVKFLITIVGSGGIG